MGIFCSKSSKINYPFVTSQLLGIVNEISIMNACHNVVI
jgi:hypothetical protein